MNPVIDISAVTLTTERLILRPWSKDDLSELYDYARVDGVGQMAGWLPHKTIEDSERVLNMFIEGKKTFAIVYEDHVIGSLGIEEYDEKLSPEFQDLKVRELGFVLAKQHWGKGFMSEAVKKVERYCFEQLQLDALLCGHFTRNIRSASVQKKCGFHYLKDNMYHTRYDTVEPSVTNILWKKEWEQAV